jgi:activator of 2-hydroxyglutaryl-CoA dehydratase
MMIPVGIDKGSQHTKQIIAELTEPVGRIIQYEILELTKSIGTREEKPQQ